MRWTEHCLLKLHEYFYACVVYDVFCFPFWQIFVQKLVSNLYNEGNDLYKEGHKNDSVNQYSEALSLANYAASEEIVITSETLERLHVNRAACYLAMVIWIFI